MHGGAHGARTHATSPEAAHIFRRKHDTDESNSQDSKPKGKNRARATAEVVEAQQKLQTEEEKRLETATRLVNALLGEGTANGASVESLEGTPPIFLEGLSNLHITVTGQFGQGPKVVSRWTVHGDHTGEMLGAPPTWQEIRVSGVMILVIDGDALQRGWIFWDLPGLMERLGR